MKSDERPQAAVVTSRQFPYQLPSLKCVGSPWFRSTVARDLACILDVEPGVLTWSTRPEIDLLKASSYRPDFKVSYFDESTCFVDAPDRAATSDFYTFIAHASDLGLSHKVVDRRDLYGGFRLRNAKDLLRYSHFKPTLSDRLRLLSVLEEQSTLTIADCLRMLTGRDPVAAVASLILHNFLEVDFDEALIGPETIVRRKR